MVPHLLHVSWEERSQVPAAMGATCLHITPTPSLSSPACTRPPSTPHCSIPVPAVGSVSTRHENRHQLPPHSRGCRVDVLAHPLAVRWGALAPGLGLALLHCALWGCLLELCLLPLLSNLWWSRDVAGPKPLGLDRPPLSPSLCGSCALRT